MVKIIKEERCRCGTRNKLIRSDGVHAEVRVRASLSTYEQNPVLTPSALTGLTCEDTAAGGGGCGGPCRVRQGLENLIPLETEEAGPKPREAVQTLATRSVVQGPGDHHDP